jgi:hypothetical protein
MRDLDWASDWDLQVFRSRPSSRNKSWSFQPQSHQSQSYTRGTLSHSFLSLPPRSNALGTDSRLKRPYKSETPTWLNTFTSTSYGFTDTSATTSPGTSPMRPQVSPHSPLSSVRNIIAAWKSRSPSIDKSSQVSPTDTRWQKRDSSTYGARPRWASSKKELQRMVLALSGEAVLHSGEISLLMISKCAVPHPRTSTSLTPSGMVPPPFDLTELGTFAEEVIAMFVHCRAFVLTTFSYSLCA